MKKMKKLLSMVSAAIMLIAMTTTVFAATTVTKPAGDTTHTYSVYQIMTGTVDGDGNISSALWGENAASGYTGAVNATDLATIKSASSTNREILNIVEPFVDVESTPFATIAADGTISKDLTSGYYLVKDTTVINGNDENPDSLNTYVIKVTDGTNLVITEKRDVPELTKTVKQNSTADANSISTVDTHGAVADYAVGDSIEFKLKATLPSNYADYKYYVCTFKDEMSGLKYKDGMKVEIFDNSNASRGVVKATEYSGVPTAGAKLFNLAMGNLVDGVNVTNGTVDSTIYLVPSDYIVVTYNAELDTNDVQYNKANLNGASLLYSSNPNAANGGDLDKTPKKKAVVFTYKVSPKKVDKLSGDIINNVTFYLRESIAVDAKYGKLIDGVFDSWVTNKSDATVLSSGSTGSFDIKGLDEGTYALEEIAAASNYIKLDPFTFTISAYWVTDATDVYALDSTKKLITTSDTANTSTAINSDEILVQNTPISALPTTGGIGTTVFYVVGGIMMVAATVLLVIKKKMSKV